MVHLDKARGSFIDIPPGFKPDNVTLEISPEGLARVKYDDLSIRVFANQYLRVNYPFTVLFSLDYPVFQVVPASDSRLTDNIVGATATNVYMIDNDLTTAYSVSGAPGTTETFLASITYNSLIEPKPVTILEMKIGFWTVSGGRTDFYIYVSPDGTTWTRIDTFYTTSTAESIVTKRYYLTIPFKYIKMTFTTNGTAYTGYYKLYEFIVI
jgi:hypothetical protein